MKKPIQIFRLVGLGRRFSTKTSEVKNQGLSNIETLSFNYPVDKQTNVNPKIISYLGRNIHLMQNNPLNLVRQRIVKYMHSSFVNRAGNPQFSVYDRLSPIVKVTDNFDSLLVPQDHVSRKPSDSFYLNKEYMLRAHTTAHNSSLISTGLDNFIIIGDVYRRDEIDKNHFPVFHQVDAVRLRCDYELFSNVKDQSSLAVFEKSARSDYKQGCHTMESVKLMEHDLKTCLSNLLKVLFGKGVEYRWVDAYFPFTHPSWELEVKLKDEWLEVVGCGILEHEILQKAGAGYKIGWAFGMGLERIAMKLYNIPDIRLFWSNDSGFLSQFTTDDIYKPITYKAISSNPQCFNDISFWIPDKFEPNDFYDLVRGIGGDLVEQVEITDNFTHPKLKRTSHCYRIIYRHMERPLKQTEVNFVHKAIEEAAVKELKVELR